MAGIQDTDVIDIVAQDADGECMLVMIEERPWNSDPDQPMQLREKINTYAGYVLDGGLAAIDVPPEVDVLKVYELLERGLKDRVWTFEEGTAVIPSTQAPVDSGG